MNKKLYELLMFPSIVSFSLKSNEYVPCNDNIEYFMDPDVNDASLGVYLEVLQWLIDGLSYDEIINKIDSLNLEEFKRLTSDKIRYVKDDAKKIITLRKERK